MAKPTLLIVESLVSLGAFHFTPQEDTHDGTYGCPVLDALRNRVELGCGGNSNHGHSHPLVYIGLAYEEGYGVKQNYKKAFSYYKQAHELEPGVGTYHLAKCYEKGLGCKPNLVEAKRLFDMVEAITETSNKPKC